MGYTVPRNKQTKQTRTASKHANSSSSDIRSNGTDYYGNETIDRCVAGFERSSAQEGAQKQYGVERTRNAHSFIGPITYLSLCADPVRELDVLLQDRF